MIHITNRNIIVLPIMVFFCLNVVAAREYNKHKDFNYDFDTTKANIINLYIDNKKFLLLPSDEKFHTAFLEINIKTSFIGFPVQPRIELWAKNAESVQYFDFSTKGTRYVNLSEYVQNGIEKIYFKTKKCRIIDKHARIILFKNPVIENERLVVLATHPDDAEIAAYGLYASNKNTFVVNITIGDAGKKMYDELYVNDTVHYIKKAEIRIWNSITVPLLAGLDPQNCINLGYFDASLKFMYLHPDRLAKSKYTGKEDINIYREMNISSFLDPFSALPTWESLVVDLKRIVEINKPTVIVTPYPAIDVHPDHKLTTQALLQALKETNYTDVELWMYTNHFVYSEMYPVGKAGSLIPLPPNTSDETIYFDRIYSHTLNGGMQSDKTLALEAMNPLRPDTEWHTTRGSWKLFLKTFRENIRNTEQDYYYRRAVRNNELFFVVDGKNILNDEIFKTIIGNMEFLSE